MEGYRVDQEQHGLEPWPNLEDDGDEVLDGRPSQSGRVDWGDVEHGPAAGVWSCTPGSFRSFYTFSELCSILDGAVTIETEDGSTHDFGPGDSFFVPQGETVVWTIHETVTKAFMMYIATD